MSVEVRKSVHLATFDCEECGITFGIPECMEDRLRASGNTFCCPNGHSLRFWEGAVRKLQKEIAKQKYRAEQLEAKVDTARGERDTALKERAAAERKTSAQKGVVTRMKRRVANGVCPCCNRSFPESKLAKHIATKHPDFAESDA